MKIHFIGIGGIGVSALAQYYLEKGHQISGSDLVSSEITEFLAAKGIGIVIGNTAEHITAEINTVVYSPAVKPDNPEYKQAQVLGIKLMSYPEALGELTAQYATIAISGSHGKSTTTAMAALVLIKAGIDPTVIVGTKLKEFGNSNFRMGKSNYLVIEACEYDGSFLNYKPYITVITNVDKEHLDYFKTFANVIKAFKNFILRIPADGFLVFNNDDKNVKKISRGKFSALGYSLRQTEAKKIKKILKIPGQHNVSNALAVLAVARILKIKDSITFKSLSEFKGSWRRFETKESAIGDPPSSGGIAARQRKITVISDYGHHPTEVLATLKAVREKYSKKKIWCIFQPHQYQRTFYLFADFVKLFKKIKINQVIICDIYDVAGREEEIINKKMSSKVLVDKINKKNVRYLSMDDAQVFVKENMKSGEVLIIMGAGDIYKLVDKF